MVAGRRALDERPLPAFRVRALVLLVRDEGGLDFGLESREKSGGGEGAAGDDEGEVVREVGRGVVLADWGELGLGRVRTGRTHSLRRGACEELPSNRRSHCGRRSSC